MANPLARASYLISAHTLRQLPEGGREVCFAGRSNAGKSSALNALCHHTGLARTSKTPGRTQQLVYFQVEEGRYLVDLPGYGYAKVPPELRAHWQEFVNRYFQIRETLAGLVVVMDCRHPLRDYDLQMLDFAAARQLPAHCLLTKADKIGRGEQGKTLAAVRKQLAERYGELVTLQLFSSSGKLGIEEARSVVCGWLQL